LIFGLADRSATAVDVTRLNGSNDQQNGSFRNETLTF